MCVDRKTQKVWCARSLLTGVLDLPGGLCTHGETREVAAERFVRAFLIFGRGMPEHNIGQKIADAPISVFCCRVTGFGVVRVNIVLVECRCPTDKLQRMLLAGLSGEGQRLYRDGQWRPIFDFCAGLASACVDPRHGAEDLEVHRAYAAATHSLLTQLRFGEDNAMSWMHAPEALLRPVEESPRPSKRPRRGDASRQSTAVAAFAHDGRLSSDEAAECAEEGERHWVESIIGHYERAEGSWNDRHFFRCKTWSSTRTWPLEVSIYFATEPKQRAGWWIFPGWEGSSQSLHCAANTITPPRRRWTDLEGAPVPAGFTVSANEDGRAVNALIERSRAAKPQGTPGAGQVELPHVGGAVETQSQDGSALKQLSLIHI